MILQNARFLSVGVIGNANKPDVFKVPSRPDPNGKGKALDIAKELENGNKAVVVVVPTLFSGGTQGNMGFIYRGTEFALVRLIHHQADDG